MITPKFFTKDDVNFITKYLTIFIENDATLIDVLTGKLGIYKKVLPDNTDFSKFLQYVKLSPEWVAANYIQLHAKQVYTQSKHENGSVWYRIGASIALSKDVKQELLVAMEPQVDLLQNHVKHNPHLIYFDGEMYSPEGHVNVPGFPRYAFIDEEH